MIDKRAAADLARLMRDSQVGKRAKWNLMIKRLESGVNLRADEAAYLSTMAHVYGGPVRSRSRIYHVRLADDERAPQCSICGSHSRYYCNLNDAYYCEGHVVGHDTNEL